MGLEWNEVGLKGTVIACFDGAQDRRAVAALIGEKIDRAGCCHALMTPSWKGRRELAGWPSMFSEWSGAIAQAREERGHGAVNRNDGASEEKE